MRMSTQKAQTQIHAQIIQWLRTHLYLSVSMYYDTVIHTLKRQAAFSDLSLFD